MARNFGSAWAVAPAGDILSVPGSLQYGGAPYEIDLGNSLRSALYVGLTCFTAYAGIDMGYQRIRL